MNRWLRAIQEGFISIGEGMVSLFDLAGARRSARIEKLLGRTDAEALASDWAAVGRDIETAMNDFWEGWRKVRD